MQIYSRQWVRSILFNIVIWPTIQLYAAFFVVNVIIQGHRRAKSSGNKPLFAFWQITGVIVGGAFLFADVLYDITCGSIWFRKMAEWGSRDKTFTARLKYYKKEHKEMISSLNFDQDIVDRYELAVKFCTLINKVQEDHC